MGLVRHRWKLPFRRSSFHSSSSSSSLLQPPSPVINPPDLPPEFLCPISGALMADPVIVPSGETFERACIEACRDLSVSPPSLSTDLSSSLLLIPNSALRSAIIRWCDIAGVPHPLTISSEAAVQLARLLSPSSQLKPPAELPNEISSPTASSSSCQSTSSSSSSSEAISAPKPQIPETPLHADPLEENIMAKLKHAKIQELESTLTSLLETTRESASCRVALGSPRLLAVLKDLLHSGHSAVKSTVLAVIVNLSLEPENKVRVIRSGVVPAIVDALRPSSPSTATEHAAGALFSLALEEQNRTVIGVLGAVPPLLRLFCASEVGFRLRLEAGMALHYLCLSEINITKVARIPGAVKGLIAVARADERALRRVAMRLMMGMVESKEGKAAMLDGGAVEAAVALLRTEEPPEDDGEEEEEMAVQILYGMSSGGLRFRGIAARAGAAPAIERAAERSEGEKKEMAAMILQAIRGDSEMEKDIARILWAEAVETEEEKSGGASEKLAAGRRIKQDSGSGSGRISAGF